MTQYLWNFLEMHVETWDKTILMANIDIKDSGFTEKETKKYYKDLKEEWVTEFKKLKLIEIDGTRYCMDEEKHPVVLEPSLEQFLLTMIANISILFTLMQREQNRYHVKKKYFSGQKL